MLSIDVAVIGDDDQFVADSVQSTQNVEPLMPGRGLDKQPGERPKETEKRRENEVSGINKEYLSKVNL